MEKQEEIITITTNDGEEVNVMKEGDYYIVVHKHPNIWKEFDFLDTLDEINENTYKLLMAKFGMKKRYAEAKIKDYLDYVYDRGVWG